MIKLATIVLVLLAVSCAPKLEQTPVSPVAPTVRKPAPVKPVDLAPVRDRTRQVEESNRQLSGELSKNKALVFDLRKQLQAASVAAIVTPEQWDGLKERAEELEASRAELETINADQQSAITELNSALVHAVTDTQIVQGALTETQSALDDANRNIDVLSQQVITVMRERDAAISVSAKSDGIMKELRDSRRKWSWAFWGCLALLVPTAYLAARGTLFR